MQFFCFRKESKPGVNYKIYQDYLLKYLEENELEKFKELLESKDKYNINPDHVYGGNYDKTCLAEASKKGLTQFIEALLNKGADPNIVSSIHFGKAAIHFAAEEGHIDAVKCLVNHPPTNKNAIDKHGNTALHLLASKLTVDGKNREAYFLYLANLKDVDIRHRNARDMSAISMALKKCSGKCSGHKWQDVLQRRDLRPEDRQLILDKYPDLKDDIRENIEPPYRYDDAYTDLRNKDFKTFKSKFKAEFVNETELIETTFLQLACKIGRPDIVQLLLDSKADVNKTGTHEDRPPVHLACYGGQYEILVRLFKTGKVIIGFVNEKSLFHSVLEGLGYCTGRTDGYRECFDYLLKYKLPEIPISHRDKYGHTALHYAADFEDDHYAKALVQHKAYIGHRNKFGFSPLHDMSPQTLEGILDNCVSYTKTNDHRYDLKFDFNVLNPAASCDKTVQTGDAEAGRRTQERLPETSPLYFISRSNKLGHLLKHPVLLVFLHLKWTRICMFFLMNMIYYIAFVSFLTANVLSETYSPEKSNRNWVWVILLVLTSILVVREFIQFCLLPKKWRYFFNLENILEVCIILATILILVGKCCRLLAAVTLLMAWMEIILQFGYFFKLAVYNEMMKRVTLNYMEFSFWCLLLILAFSFSFYQLYHKENPSEGKSGSSYVNSASGKSSFQDDNVDFYSNISLSLVKTVVMMIGEFDASSMSFDNGSYFVFLFFVFMMTIVMMNLLNGLAVSDTQAIRNDAELVVYRSRVKLVHHFERVVFGGCCGCQLTGGSPSLCCPWQGRLQKAISLFPDTFPDGRLSVVLDHEPRYTNLYMKRRDSDEEFRPDTCCKIGTYRMGLHIDREVLIAAKDIVDQREKQSSDENSQIVNRIGKVEDDLQGCKDQLENLEKLLKQIINNK